MSEVAKLIKKRRRELGMSLEDVAKKVGVGRSTVRKWEEGMIKSIKSDKLEALSDVLQISPVELVPGKKKSFKEAALNAVGALAEPIRFDQPQVKARTDYGLKEAKVVRVNAEPSLNAMLKVWRVADPKAKEEAVRYLEYLNKVK